MTKRISISIAVAAVLLIAAGAAYATITLSGTQVVAIDSGRYHPLRWR